MSMGVAIVTGSAGLVGSEVVRHVADKGMVVVGIDNDMRRKFFGNEASTHGEVAKRHDSRASSGGGY